MHSEAGFLSKIRSLAANQAEQSRLIKGIGDDCAILRPNARHDLVFTTDFVLQNRHFTLDSHRATDIGHKALARSLSDLAAMGSKPLFCLVSLAIPARLGTPFISGFYKGLLKLAKRHGVALAGGDLASFDYVVADVVCCGEVPTGEALLRSNARPGDAVYVSGELGASAHGLRKGRGRSFRRHLRPEPRVDLGQKLRSLGVRCCMDVSDGLALDLHRLCQESGVGAVIDDNLPLAKGATQEEALTGGEDYELLFAAPKNVPVPEEIDGVQITKIGLITRSTGNLIRFCGRPLTPQGFDHFQNNPRGGFNDS